MWPPAAMTLTADDLLAHHTFSDETFTGLDLSGVALDDKDFDGCTFVRCRLNEARLHRVAFDECTFERCDLTMIRFDRCAFTDVRFVGTKMMGVDLSSAGLAFDATFEDCVLTYASFADMALQNRRFDRCALEEADFSGTNLTGTVFADCSLARANFDRTTLRKADLRSSTGVDLNPEACDLRGAKVSVELAIALAERLGLVVDRG